MIMKIVDDKVKENLWKYLSQCFLATLTILAVLLFLDVLDEAAIIAADVATKSAAMKIEFADRFSG